MSIDLQFDRQHLWHPYTSMASPLPVYPVRSADGCTLILDDGRELIDGTSSWWAAIHGYNHPELNAAVTQQLQQMSHVMFGGITHAPAVELGKLLLELVPANLRHIFYADSGSIAVEVALKMALQYQLAIGNLQKSRVLSLRKAYHGDTFATMALCDPVDGMHAMFQAQLTSHLFAPAPTRAFDDDWQNSDGDALREMFAQHHQQLAAFVIEPVLQGAGGMRLYHPQYLRLARQLCDQYQVLLICDEIATGFGRTGKLFAVDHAGIQPDIMCLGKALSGGYITLAATLCSVTVADGISSGAVGALMHGPTYMANPLACAVACASLKIIQTKAWQTQVTQIEQQLKQLKLLAQYPAVKAVRVLGAVGIVEMKGNIDVAKAQALMVAQGVWIRPFGKLFYLMPPYTIQAAELDQLIAALQFIVQQDVLHQAQALPGA
ncbi:adenosylmethionine--8-amino-7-oxononanoate transaminase [Rheinheimera sp.]|uniref:adenosylmethionine--8-amino-7-oxononanoate transaminase n=1 Tax=Rheinheimera sp. TaxID=1869214 RepID=UPI003D2AEE18